MPLSKKKNRERMRRARATYVQPKQAWEITNWADVDIEANPHLKAPIPSCPDGRYRV